MSEINSTTNIIIQHIQYKSRLSSYHDMPNAFGFWQNMFSALGNTQMCLKLLRIG